MGSESQETKATRSSCWAMSIAKQTEVTISTPHNPGKEVDLDYVLHCTENWAEHRLVGEGSYGKVYQGIDSLGHKQLQFAAKRLECTDEEQRKMLKQATEAEIKTLSLFIHPNIIKLLGFCKSGDTAVLLYEFEPRGSVDGHLRIEEKAKKFSWSARARVVKGLLAAIHHLYTFESGCPCYHRDVKPGNIVLAAEGEAKLIDCGLAKLVTPNPNDGKSNRSFHATSTSGAAGTPGFRCPKYERTGIFDEKSEMYSVGVTILQQLG